MLKNNKQQIKVTIHQTKLTYPLFQSFFLNLKLNDISLFTDKITEKVYDYNKSFIFEIPFSDFAILEIIVFSTSLIVLESEIAKVNLNLNLSNLKEDNIEWLTLINDMNEDVCMIQISFGLNNKIRRSKGSENEIKPKARVNYSIDESNLNKKDKSTITKKLNNTTSQDKKLDKTESSNLDDTIVYDESSKSPDISNICNEFFSPKSHRDTENFYLNHTTVKSKIIVEDTHHNLSANNYNNFNFEKLFDATSLNPSSSECGLDIEKANDFLKKLKKKKVEMKEKEKKLLKEQEDLRVIKEKLRQRETLLTRENKKLEMQLHQIELDKQEYESHIKSKNTRFQRLEMDLMKFETMKNLHDFDKDVFTTMNKLINSYHYLEANHSDISFLDNIGMNCHTSSKKKSIDFTSPYEFKSKKSIKRYNTEHMFSVYNPNPKLNNLNNITILESSDFAYSKGGHVKKECVNISLIKEFNHLDISPDKNLGDIKELDESQSIYLDKKISHKIFYNIHQTKIPNNTSFNMDIINPNIHKKNNYESHKVLNNTVNQNNKPIIKSDAVYILKNKEIKSNNLNSPINGNLLQKNLETYVAIEKNKQIKNQQQSEKRRISEDKKHKLEVDISKKKNIILAKINKDNLSNSKKSSNEKSSNERKINLKSLSGNSNHISTNNSSMNSNNAHQKQLVSKANKKLKN